MIVQKRLVVGRCYMAAKDFYLQDLAHGPEATLEKGSGPWLVVNLYRSPKQYGKAEKKLDLFVVELMSPEGRLITGMAYLQYLSTHRNFVEVTRQ